MNKTSIRKTVSSALALLLVAVFFISSSSFVFAAADLNDITPVTRIVENTAENFTRSEPNPDWIVNAIYEDDGTIIRTFYDADGYQMALEVISPLADTMEFGAIDPSIAEILSQPVLRHRSLFEVTVQQSNVEWTTRRFSVEFDITWNSSHRSYFTWMWVSHDTTFTPIAFPPGAPRPMFQFSADRGRTASNNHTAWASFWINSTSLVAEERWSVSWPDRVTRQSWGWWQ